MRTFLLGLLLACLSMTPAHAAERVYSVSDFDRIIVEGPYVVRLTQTRSTSARATGTRDALEQLVMDVTGQTLRIRRDRTGERSGQAVASGPVTIILSSPNLRSAALIGPGRIEVDKAEGLRVELSVQGSGRMRVARVEADQLAVGLRGSGRIEIEGEAKTLRLTIDGSGDFDGSALRAESAVLVTNSSGDVSLAAGREVDVSAQGLGLVEITGRPSCNVQGPGAGLVRCGSDQRQGR